KESADKAPAQKADAAQDDKPNNRRGGRGGRGDNNRQQNNRNDNRVVGLGDHTPEFIGLSFAERRE
ncbi:MAG: DEAD/DEAH box helicase, partial [Sulfitobacter pontiacus]